MDCGKTFTATVERKTGKPVGCLYWGKLDPHQMRYSWGLPMETLFWELDNSPEWQKLMAETPWYKKLFKKVIPWYYYDFEKPTAKPWTSRLKLKIKELWMKREMEMWTCHECTVRHEEE